MCIRDRQQLISSLVTVWESSIRATHDFFSETNIREIKKYVFQAIEEIPILVVAVDNKETLAFMGIAEDKLEMLFITCLLYTSRWYKRQEYDLVNSFQLQFYYFHNLPR